MSSKSITLDTQIDAAPERIIDFLMQPENYVSLQPFIVSSRTITRGQDAAGHPFVEYESVERVPLLGGLRLNTPLRVISTVNHPGAQMTSVVHSTGTRVEFVYDLRPENGLTHLTLTVTAHVPRLISGFVISRAKEAQTVLLAGLKQRLEPSPFSRKA